MNLYFISLLRKEVERKKNRENYYVTRQENMSVEYIRKRYPYISLGDTLSFSKFIHEQPYLFYHGDRLEDWSPTGLHPFFYTRENNSIQDGYSHLSSLTLNRISNSIFERKEDHFLISNFKIGKTKYEVAICDYEQNIDTLEQKVRDMDSFYFVTKDILKEWDAYKLKYKKRLIFVFD
jgi:hypothetical protein